MQRFTKSLLILSLSMLAGTISLMLVAASMMVINYLHDRQPTVSPVGW